MAESAAGQVIVASRDRDFAETLAEQVRSELALPCLVISDKETIKQYVELALVIVSTEGDAEMVQESLPCPQITVKNPPVRVLDILGDIARLAEHPAVEAIGLGNGCSLEMRQKQLACAGKSVSLTDKEAQLLKCLAEAKGQVVGKDQLLKTVWGFGEALDTHTLETHIYRLRGKFRELLGRELSGDDTMIAATEGGYVLTHG